MKSVRSPNACITTVWALILTVHCCFVAPGVVGAKEPEPVKLSFPANISLGRLFVAYPSSKGIGYRSDKKLMSEGRGELSFPAGTFVEFKLSYDGVDHAQDLLKLDPRPFVMLDCRSLDNLNDQTLKYIGHFSNLVALSLDETDSTDLGLESLRSLKKLSRLDLKRTLITGKSFAVFKNFSQLRILHLAYNKLNEASLSNLSFLPELRELDLSVTGIGDSALPSVAACSKLESLDLFRNQNITDAGLAAVKKLANLRSLNVADTRVTAHGLEQLKDLPLTSLDLNMKNASQAELTRLETVFPHCNFKSGPHSRRPPEFFAPLK